MIRRGGTPCQCKWGIGASKTSARTQHNEWWIRMRNRGGRMRGRGVCLVKRATQFDGIGVALSRSQSTMPIERRMERWSMAGSGHILKCHSNIQINRTIFYEGFTRKSKKAGTCTVSQQFPIFKISNTREKSRGYKYYCLKDNWLKVLSAKRCKAGKSAKGSIWTVFKIQWQEINEPDFRLKIYGLDSRLNKTLEWMHLWLI